MSPLLRRKRPVSSLLHNPIIIAWDRLVRRLHDARSIGYLTVFLILVAVLGISWHLWQVTISGQQKAWVVFSHNAEAISALQNDDPVVISGVLVGRVDHIEPIPDGARVLVTFFNYQKLRVDAHAINFPQGLMGQRAVVIDRGDAAEQLRDGGSIAGRFQPGMAETMSQIQVLVAKVNAVNRQSQAWIQGDSLHAPAYQRIQKTIATLQTVAADIDAATNFAAQASGKLSQVDDFSRSLQGGLHSTDATITKADGALDPALDKLQRDIAAIRPLISRMDTLNAQLHDTSSALIRTLYDDSLYRQLESLNHSVREAEDMAKGRMKIPFHFNLWRTFRFSRPERKNLP